MKGKTAESFLLGSVNWLFCVWVWVYVWLGRNWISLFEFKGEVGWSYVGFA